MSERLGPPNGPRIRDTVIDAADLVVLPAGTRLVRVHLLSGPHPVTWNRFRSWGPTSSRFDHHPLPVAEHPPTRVAYLAFGDDAFTTALAEFFQDADGGVGPLDLTHRRPAVALIDTVAELRLLNLDSGWVTRAGGNQAIRTGPRSASRAWARMIHRHHTDLHGLAYGSSVWVPGRCAALWEGAEGALGSAPVAHRTLDDPVLASPVGTAVAQLGTFVL